MTDCQVCDGDGEVYYDSDHGPVYGPCIMCSHERFMEWVTVCEEEGFETAGLLDSANGARADSDPLGRPF